MRIDRAGMWMLTAGLCTAMVATVTAEAADRRPELPGQTARPATVQARLIPVTPGGPANSVAAGGCTSETIGFSQDVFDGGAFNVQAGLVKDEVFAVSFTLDPSAFPVTVNGSEMIWATSGALVQTTTQWSWLVWQGTPDTGTLVAQFSSADGLLPSIVLGPGDAAVNAQVIVDPNDPEQIIVLDDGSATFTVGYRIDQHNLQELQCAATNLFNAFPTTDLDGVSEPGSNWLCASPLCPSCPSTCTSFAGQPAECTPSGDIILRATYTPFSCPGEQGACCLPDQSCLPDLIESECDVVNGVYQGDGTSCNDIVCPEPMGACCFMPTGCIELLEMQCTDVEGFYQGDGTTCDSIICFETGACCFPDGSCLEDQDPTDCLGAGGTYQGSSSTCAQADCPQPDGACCFQNGNCIVLSQADCEAVPTNVWQGAFTSCDPNPCSVTGACCFENGTCLLLSEEDCNAAPGTTWLADTDCDADPCCPADCALGDGQVDVTDLLTLLAQWGGPGSCDLDGSGMTDVVDILALLAEWGPCEG